MRLNYFLPAPVMRPFLTMHMAADRVTAPRDDVLPTMLPNLHIRLSGQSRYVFADGRMVEAPPVSLIGPTSNAYRILFNQGFSMVGIGFLPAGWQSLMGVSASECTDRLIDGADLWGPQAVTTLLETLYRHPLDGSQTALVEAFLLRQSIPVTHHGSWQLQAIDHWLEHSRALSLDTICAELGVGGRQLRRITLDHYGMSPKMLAMKYRALRFANALCQAPDTTVAQALQSYADQSHAIRDFQRFIGWTPGAFGHEQRSLARATLTGRLQAGAGRPLVLLS